MLSRSIVAAVLLTATASSCSGAAAASAARAVAAGDAIAVVEPDAAGARRLPLVRRNGFLVTPVTIDGRAAGEFLVDTGAGATIVDRRLADELRLPRVVDAKVQGALFQGTAEVRTLHRLAAGGIELVTVPTLALDLEDVRANLGDRVTGVIGYPTLGTFPFTVDFVDAALTIHDFRRFEPPAGVASELVRVHQVPYVEATLEHGTVVWLQLDTGSAFGVTLWREFVRQRPEVLTVPQKRGVQTSGIGGGARVMESEVRFLRVFGRDYAKVPVIIHDAPSHGWNHPRVAGRVGIGLLKDLRVTIHPGTRRMWVTQ